jgi:hypothetical protein
MAYKLYNASGEEISHHDLQDKGFWCHDGASQEVVFVEKYGKSLNLAINPQKQNNPYAPDLINLSDHRLGDLKTQNTPFFQSMSRFGLDPQYTVVFNAKDRLRYNEKYPDMDIYFAVDWIALRFESGSSIEVEPMRGVWKIPFIKLEQVLGTAPMHCYHRRQKDLKGNARGSYVISLSNNVFKRIL